MPIEALFEPHRLDEGVDVEGLRLLDQTVDRHRPRPDFQPVGGKVLARAELIEIVVVHIDLFRRHLAIERVGRVALGRIERVGRIGLVGLGPAREPRVSRERPGAGDEGAPIEENRFGSGLAGGDFPAAAAMIAHA